MRLVLARVLIALLPFAMPLTVAAQSLPQISGAGTVRPLVSADAARGWEAVGRLDSGVSFCSATLVAPDLVLTAAHCLYDENNRRIADHALRFSAGLRNGRAEAIRRVTGSHVPGDYRATQGPPAMELIARDIALLELDQPIVSGLVVPIRTGIQGRLRDVVTIVSYGRDRESYASIQEDCEIVGREDAITALTCQVVQGSSGSPILRETPSGFEIVAVVSAMGEWNGEDAAFAVDVDALLPALMAQARPARPNGSNGVTLRNVAGDGGRGNLGARFIRP